MVPGMANNALSGTMNRVKMRQTALGILYILSPALSPFQKRMSNVDKGREGGYTYGELPRVAGSSHRTLA